MGVLAINNMLVRSQVGFDPQVEDQSKDLYVSIHIRYNSYQEEESDNPNDAFDINSLSSEIIGRAGNSHFNLIEAFTRMVLNTVLEFSRVEEAEVEVKQMQDLKFTGELSFSISGSNH
jgi:D-erythro-7,8-dihydroneopterin triphosphate epimerase